MRQISDFLQNGQELRRRRKAHGSIRIQEGEPLSPAADLPLDTARNFELLDMTHLCGIIDAANAPKKRGSYKRRPATGRDGLV